jgi:hypothetical protein
VLVWVWFLLLLVPKIWLDMSRTIEFPMYLPGLTCYHEILVMLESIIYILVQKLCVPGLATRHQNGSRCWFWVLSLLLLVPKMWLDMSKTTEFPMYLPVLACYHEIMVILGSTTYILVHKLYAPGLVTRHQSGSRCWVWVLSVLLLVPKIWLDIWCRTI